MYIPTQLTAFSPLWQTDSCLDQIRDYVEVAGLSEYGVALWSVFRRYQEDGAVVGRRHGQIAHELVDDQMTWRIVRVIEEFSVYSVDQIKADL